MVITGRRSSIWFDDASGAPSIKTVIEGSCTWRTPGRRYELTPETCLVLNDNQTYGLESPPGPPVRTFCVFFLPEYLADAAQALGVRGLTGFYERMQLTSQALVGPLTNLRRVVESGAPQSMEGECAFADVAAALIVSENSTVQADRLSTSKPAVREEIFRQLNRARDYALCNLSSNISLDDLSEVATMSPFYFHRMHRQAFGETPHDFVSRGLIARGKRLLRAGHDVEEVAISLGFDSSPTFWRMFKSKTGQTPASFRKIG